MENNIKKYFLKTTSIAPLITFRIVFGAMAFIGTARFISLGWIKTHFIDTKITFKYFGFEWVHLLPPFWMYFVHSLMLISAIGIMVGAFYRISILIFFIPSSSETTCL